MASTTATSTTESITNTISDAASFVGNKASELTAGASKEGNKEVAKGNTGAGLGDRASAGIDALGDKFDETKAGSKAEANKQSATH
ncbi:Ras-related protein rsr1 [Rhodotorula kratochvilovae]